MSNESGTERVQRLFTAITKTEWLEQIEKDLRGQHLDDVNWQFNDAMAISPFAHREGSSNPSDVWYSPTWELAELFHVEDVAESNAQILEALNGGCETLLLEVEGPEEWDLLFKGIALDMVITYVLPTSSEQYELVRSSIINWIAGQKHFKGNLAIRRSGPLSLGPSSDSGDAKPAKDLAKTILSALNMIENGQVVIECVAEIGVSYFVEIARLRALRILWKNLLDALELDEPGLIIEAHFSDKDMSEDVYKNMISASTKALSAICGGVDRLVIAPSGKGKDKFHRRISRNIHHLLRYESGIDKIDDPVRGSFYIESLSQKMVEEAWSEIIGSLD